MTRYRINPTYLKVRPRLPTTEDDAPAYIGEVWGEIDGEREGNWIRIVYRGKTGYVTAFLCTELDDAPRGKD